MKYKSIIYKAYRQKYLLLMLVPGFVALITFWYIPLTSWWMAFTKYRLGFGIFSGEWVGLQNFKEFFLDSSGALSLIRNTVGINVISLVVNMFGAITLAVLLNEIKSTVFKKVIQSATFFPFFISWAIIYSLAYTFLSENSGVLNNFLIEINVIKEGINFLGDPKYSWGLIVCINMWKYIGYNSVLFLSAITGIDQELYESAEMDGADRFAKIWHITLPSLLPTLQILIIMNFGWIFSSNFEQFYLFTNSTNWDSMNVFDVYIYKYGLRSMNFSYATAVGVIKSIAAVSMLLMANYVSRKINNKDIM